MTSIFSAQIAFPSGLEKWPSLQSSWPPIVAPYRLTLPSALKPSLRKTEALTFIFQALSASFPWLEKWPLIQESTPPIVASDNLTSPLLWKPFSRDKLPLTWINPASIPTTWLPLNLTSSTFAPFRIIFSVKTHSVKYNKLSNLTNSRFNSPEILAPRTCKPWLVKYLKASTSVHNHSINLADNIRFSPHVSAVAGLLISFSLTIAVNNCFNCSGCSDFSNSFNFSKPKSSKSSNFSTSSNFFNCSFNSSKSNPSLSKISSGDLTW